MLKWQLGILMKFIKSYLFDFFNSLSKYLLSLVSCNNYIKTQKVDYYFIGEDNKTLSYFFKFLDTVFLHTYFKNIFITLQLLFGYFKIAKLYFYEERTFLVIPTRNTHTKHFKIYTFNYELRAIYFYYLTMEINSFQIFKLIFENLIVIDAMLLLI